MKRVEIMLQELKTEIFHACLELTKSGLDYLGFGSISCICRPKGLLAIKPGNSKCEEITVNDIVIADMEGRFIEGALMTSSDALTHIELYKAFPGIGAISHVHSPFATMFAQAGKELQCLGITHADSFYGNIPVTRYLKENELTDYERNTGRIIVEILAGKKIENMPAVLVAGHAPYCWGKNVSEAVKNCLILEYVARLAWGTKQINPDQQELPYHILLKHFNRKNGRNNYSGQKK